MSERPGSGAQNPFDRGSAIVFAILVLALLAMLGVGLLTLSEDSAKLGRADSRAKQAFYTAEAGLEHARLALSGGVPFDDVLDTAAGGGGGIDFEPDELAPSFASDGRLIGFSAGVGDDVPLIPPTTFGDGGTYTVYLTNDAIDGVDDTDDTNGRVVLNAIGTSRGGTMETIQAIVETSESLWSQAPPAGLTIVGPVPTFTPGSGSSKLYSGTDCLGSGVPGYYAPAVGATGWDAADHVRNNKGSATYQAGGLSSDNSIADLTDLSEPAVSEVISSEWSNCVQLVDLIEEIRQQADIVCTGPSCTLPPASPDRVVFVDDDWQITSGSGVIVVTGQATMSNSVDWTGAILVVGEGRLDRQGSGNGVVSGGIVLADVAGDDGLYGNLDDCGCGGGEDEEDEEEAGGGTDCGFRSAWFDTSGSGSPTISYCSVALDDVNIPDSDITDFRQR